MFRLELFIEEMLEKVKNAELILNHKCINKELTPKK